MDDYSRSQRKHLIKRVHQLQENMSEHGELRFPVQENTGTHETSTNQPESLTVKNVKKNIQPNSLTNQPVELEGDSIKKLVPLDTSTNQPEELEGDNIKKPDSLTNQPVELEGDSIKKLVQLDKSMSQPEPEELEVKNVTKNIQLITSTNQPEEFNDDNLKKLAQLPQQALWKTLEKNLPMHLRSSIDFASIDFSLDEWKKKLFSDNEASKGLSSPQPTASSEKSAMPVEPARNDGMQPASALSGQTHEESELKYPLGLLPQYQEFAVEIERILKSNEHVGHHIIIPDPLKVNRLFIIGVNVTRIMRSLREPRIKKLFQQFKIEVYDVESDDRKALPHYYTPLMYCTLRKEKRVHLDDGDTDYENTNKCQLIIIGDRLGSRPETRQSYYGVTVAHGFLKSQQIERLWNSDAEETRINNEVLHSNWNYGWSMLQHQQPQKLSMAGAPRIKSREYFERRNDFLLDIALFEVFDQELREQQLLPVRGAQGSNLLKFYSRGKPYTVRGVLSIKTREHLNSLRGKKVLIANEVGTLGSPPFSAKGALPAQGSVHLGLHTVFAIPNGYGFEVGSSGSIVFVVARDDKHVYILGMLSGYSFEIRKRLNYNVYKVVILEPCLEKMGEEYVINVRNLRYVEGCLPQVPIASISLQDADVTAEQCGL